MRRTTAFVSSPRSSARLPDCEVTFAEGASPDPRSYRVDFSKFAAAFPSCSFEWTAERGADELAKGYEAVGLTFEDFEGDRYIRLGQLRRLSPKKRRNRKSKKKKKKKKKENKGGGEIYMNLINKYARASRLGASVRRGGECGGEVVNNQGPRTLPRTDEASADDPPRTFSGVPEGTKYTPSTA